MAEAQLKVVNIEREAIRQKVLAEEAQAAAAQKEAETQVQTSLPQ